MRRRRWQVLARNPADDSVRQVVRVRGGGYRRAHKRERLRRFRMTGREARRAERWATRKGLVCYRSTDRWPWLVLDSDTRHARRGLSKRLDRLARSQRRYFHVREGWRTNARQWQLWALYGPGRAAYPGTSRHESGNAADIGVFVRGRSGATVNLGDWRGGAARRDMRVLGLCLNVPRESWHCERGTTWRA